VIFIFIVCVRKHSDKEHSLTLISQNSPENSGKHLRNKSEKYTLAILFESPSFKCIFRALTKCSCEPVGRI
jgi:hypothetical protein